jgi:hypothetical protein
LPVGQVHLGIVHVFELETPDVKRPEVDLTDAGFTASAELAAEKDCLRAVVAICAGGAGRALT